MQYRYRRTSARMHKGPTFPWLDVRVHAPRSRLLDGSTAGDIPFVIKRTTLCYNIVYCWYIAHYIVNCIGAIYIADSRYIQRYISQRYSQRYTMRYGCDILYRCVLDKPSCSDTYRTFMIYPRYTMSQRYIISHAISHLYR